MNYIKYLADARLINIIYPVGQDYPKKPTKVMLHNPNLYQVFTELEITKQRLMETFMVNTLWKDHKVNQSGKEIHYTIDGSHRFKVCRSSELTKLNAKNKGTLYCQYDSNKVSDNMIPLWLLGFLY